MHALASRCIFQATGTAFWFALVYATAKSYCPRAALLLANSLPALSKPLLLQWCAAAVISHLGQSETLPLVRRVPPG